MRTKKINVAALNKALENVKTRSAWQRGVVEYAYELVDRLNDDDLTDELEAGVSDKRLESILLNGAANWREYSYGGNSLIYNNEIAKRLCNASELKKTLNGQRNPNRLENWCDAQTRALFQAFELIKKVS